MHRKFVGVVSLYFHFISPRNCFTLPSIARRPHPATTEATALLVASRFARRFPSRVLCCGDDCSVSMHSAMCILHKYHHYHQPSPPPAGRRMHSSPWRHVISSNLSFCTCTWQSTELPLVLLETGQLCLEMNVCE